MNPGFLQRSWPRPRSPRGVRRQKLALLALCCAAVPLWWSAPAKAHDSWLQRADDGGGLLLGTGNQFPVMESAIDAPYLVRAACQAGAGGAQTLATGPLTPVAIRLQPPADSRSSAMSCWVQSTAFDVELAADKIPLYLQEVRPPPAVLAAWAAMKARGLPWRERYVKHARIELPGALSDPANADPATADAAPPSGLGMDMRLQGPRGVRRAGQPLVVQLLRDGQPLADHAVEWRHALGRLGVWRRTDAQGLVSLTPTLSGRWLLRGIDLRLSDERPDSFDSRFMTLALEVAPAP